MSLNGCDLSMCAGGQVVVVGEIVEVNETQTNIYYKIDDRTGPLIEVRRWINAEVCLLMLTMITCNEITCVCCIAT